MSASRVIVLDGEQRASLAVTRSFGKKGIDVFVGSTIKQPLAGASRYADGTFTYPSPADSPEGFISELQTQVRKNSIGIIMPITDMTMTRALKHADDLKPAIIPFAPIGKYTAASDKMSLLRLAEKIGIPVPGTIFVDEPQDIERHIPGVKYPAVLKPRSSIIERAGVLTKSGVIIVRSEAELLDAVREHDAFSEPYMIQEMVIGEGVGIFALFNRGRSVAVFAHRRLREKPPWGGVSVLSESMKPDPEIREYAIRLLAALEWEGPAMVEFKRDKTRGVPVLMEINARFWGSLQLAINSGVDFPYLLHEIFSGRDVAPVMEYGYSKLRWLLGDLDNLYISLKTDRSRLPAGQQNKVKVCWHFIREFLSSSREEVFNFDDPNPFFVELKNYLSNG